MIIDLYLGFNSSMLKFANSLLVVIKLCLSSDSGEYERRKCIERHAPHYDIDTKDFRCIPPDESMTISVSSEAKAADNRLINEPVYYLFIRA